MSLLVKSMYDYLDFKYGKFLFMQVLKYGLATFVYLEIITK